MLKNSKQNSPIFCGFEGVPQRVKTDRGLLIFKLALTFGDLI